MIIHYNLTPLFSQGLDALPCSQEVVLGSLVYTLISFIFVRLRIHTLSQEVVLNFVQNDTTCSYELLMLVLWRNGNIHFPNFPSDNFCH